MHIVDKVSQFCWPLSTRIVFDISFHVQQKFEITNKKTKKLSSHSSTLRKSCGEEKKVMNKLKKASPSQKQKHKCRSETTLKSRFQDNLRSQIKVNLILNLICLTTSIQSMI